MSDTHAIFKQFLETVKKEIGETQYAFVFSSVELVSLDDHKFVVGVPANLFKSIIEREYLEALTKIAQDTMSVSEIEIVVSDQRNAVEFFSGDKPSVPHTNKDSAVHAAPERVVVKTKLQHELNLNNNFSFENFIVGPSNSFAYSVATIIAKNPGEAHNPCLIYGDVGLGKTHLLQAIGNDVAKRFPKHKILFYPSEKFLNDFLNAIQSNKSRDFKNKIRSADILLLDDIQFFTGKPSLQEEFYHSFNTLLSEKKQMVFASDRQIHQIRDLEERLQSRFRSNMIVDLQAPSPETAMSILRNALARNKKHSISEEVLNLIVERLRYNIRDMLGVISRITGYEELTGKKVDASIIRQWTTEYIPRKNSQRTNTVDKILAVIAKYYGVTITELQSNNRNRRIARMRHIASYLLRNLTNNSLTEIGSLFNVSHVSVSKAISQLEKELDIDPNFADEIEELKLQIHQKNT